MTEEIVELNTRVTKLASIHTRRINDTREAVFMLVKALTPHLSAEEQKRINKLLRKE